MIIVQVVCYLKGFSQEQKRRLAELFVISFANGLASPTCLLALFEDYLVKDGALRCSIAISNYVCSADSARVAYYWHVVGLHVPKIDFVIHPNDAYSLLP